MSSVFKKKVLIYKSAPRCYINVNHPCYCQTGTLEAAREAQLMHITKSRVGQPKGEVTGSPISCISVGKYLFLYWN